MYKLDEHEAHQGCVKVLATGIAIAVVVVSALVVYFIVFWL